MYVIELDMNVNVVENESEDINSNINKTQNDKMVLIER